mmetsp:Transcript_44761/g.113969  ORF Transcript_44761/g.113969 Transcript_44761/m.113969 type:complete len:501 (+) Transcript_44761:75-1577(+)
MAPGPNATVGCLAQQMGGQLLEAGQPEAPLPLKSEAGGAARTEAVVAPTLGSFASSSMEEAAPRCCGRGGWPALWLVVLLDTVGNILTGLILPDLGTSYFGGGVDPCAGVGRSTPACDVAISQFTSVSATFSMLCAILHIGSGPLLGMVAGIVGTKCMMALSILFQMVSAVALVGVSWAGTSIYYYFGATVLATIVPPGFTYGLWVVENTSPNSRSVVYARLTAASSIEGIIAPLATQFLNHSNAPAVVMLFRLASVISVICCIPKNRPAARMQEILPGAMRSCISAHSQLGSIAKLFSQRSYRLVMFLVLLGGTAGAGVASIYFVTLKEKFGMDMQGLAPVLTMVTLSSLLCQLLLVKPLEGLFGLKGTILFSFAASTVSCMGYACAPSVHFVYFAALSGGLGSIAFPIVGALLANLAAPDGEAGGVAVTMGMLQSIGSVTSLTGPLLFNAVFSFFLQPSHHFTGAVWVFSILLEVVGFALATRLPTTMLVSGDSVACS